MSAPAKVSRLNSASSPSPDVIGRVPPNSPDAEQSVLGAIFRRPAILDDIGGIIRPSDFYSPVHRHVFQAALNVSERGRPVDMVSVSAELTSMGKIEDVGGSVYLAELASSVIAATHGIHHARIVQSMSARRRLIELGCNMVEDGFNLQAEVESCGRYAQEIDAAIHGTIPEGSTVTPSDYMGEYMETLTKLQEAGGLAGIPAPWDSLNRYTAGFVPGEVTILAGRSGTGKTAMALNVAEHASRLGHTVGILSLEMTRHQLTNRFMASGAEVDAQRFRNASLNRDDWSRIYRYAETFNRLPLLICDRREIRPSEIRAMCRKWKRENKLSLLVVDYLQLMKPEVRDKMREREVSEISRSLKLLSVDLEIPILVLAQLNREAEKEKRPRLGHLRESGAIEQDADIILFIVPWKTQGAPENVEIVVDVAKGRNNAVGDAAMLFKRRFLKFLPLAVNETEPHWQDT